MPNYQELIEQIQRLQQEVSVIRPELHERVLDVAKRYIVAHHPTNRGYGYPTISDADFEWNIDSSTVHVEWDEFWNYGGQDQGAFSFPVSYIWDDAALVAYEELRTEAKETNQREVRECEREKELQQLEILKEKYPETKNE